MKIILSRKGFDSQYGGIPSPILDNQTMLSFPIPMNGSRVSFEELRYKDESFYELIHQLNPKSKIRANSTCHLDPDLRRNLIKRPKDWKPLFGQCDAALSHLINNSVSPGDLFLFFGTFRHTERTGKTLRFRKDSPEMHCIYGYFQVKQFYTDKSDLLNRFPSHPHSMEPFISKKHNAILEPYEKLTFQSDISGAGVFKFSDELVLTKPGFSKSRWELPDFFKKLAITYHSKKSYKADYFQSTGRGQEFVISDSKDAQSWACELIKNYALK